MTESATRDGEIPAIFNPKRVRTPSVVVTGDSPNGPSPFSGLTNIIPQITHSDSVTSSQPGDGVESLTGIIIGDHVETQSQGSQQHHSLTLAQQNQVANSTSDEKLKSKGCKGSCCSDLAQKIYFGVFVTILITFSFVGATHCFRFLYLVRNSFITSPSHTKLHHSPATTQRTTNTIIQSLTALPYSQPASQQHSTNGFFMDTANISNNNNNNNLKIQKPVPNFNAPFFASWFCTNFNILFFPIYLFGRGFARKCGANTETLGDILRGFRDRGFTIGRFINRCLTFCILWLVTTYLYLLSLRSLFATDVMALFATNVSSVYLLSWVILHEQFVGVRIVAVILVDTGIALLAYMDGITGSPILVGVVLAALSAAGYAVFRVMFRKMLGDAPVGQIAFTFSIIGFLNAALLWPICLILYFSGVETMPWETLTVSILLVAAILLTCFHLLTQFSGAVTYNMFVTLGLITSVPVSAALDIVLYGATFAGMKLGGIILISVGFFLVMFPNNWPDYITRLLRKTGRALLRNQCCCDYGEIDYENSKYHPVRTQCQMEPPFSQYNPHKSSRKNRLSHRLHSISSSFTLGKSPVTEQNLQLYQLQNHFDSMDNYEYGNQTEPRNSFFFPSSPLNKNRNDSITETNFSIGGLNLIRKHRDSYTSLD